MEDLKVFKELFETIEDRKKSPMEGSYTNYLLDKGIDKILKKIGEEASETIIASKNSSNEEVVFEIADLLYHLMVLMSFREISLDEVILELQKRHLKVGNKKEEKKLDSIH